MVLGPKDEPEDNVRIAREMLSFGHLRICRRSLSWIHMAYHRPSWQHLSTYNPPLEGLYPCPKLRRGITRFLWLVVFLRTSICIHGYGYHVHSLKLRRKAASRHLLSHRVFAL
ncbi:hypothetical protein LIA77_05434 [Sarocladium implicatum]|nr:hypothetical protein LIA77_05434 [Sarocladium implicatum]